MEPILDKAMQAMQTTPPATPPAALERRPPKEVLRVTSDIALMDTAQFEHMQRIATIMCRMELLPVHLRVRPWFYPKKKTDNLSPAEEATWREKLGPDGFARAWEVADQRTVANCILVVDQALRWGFDPFATMGETFEVGGKLGNQGKLVIAVINARAGLQSRLDYDFMGEGPERTVTISGTFKGEGKARTVDLRVKDAKTDNQMWSKDPDQKLIYSGAVKWARRHCPEVVLGIITQEDAEQMKVIDVQATAAPTLVSEILGNGSAPAALAAAAPESIEVAPGELTPAEKAIVAEATAGETGSLFDPPTGKAGKFKNAADE